MRKVYTSRFGEIEVDEEKIVHFQNGIPAFEEEKEFIILPYKPVLFHAVAYDAGFGILADDSVLVLPRLHVRD